MNSFYKSFKNVFLRSYVIAFFLLLITASLVFADKNFFSSANMINILLKAAKNGGFLALGISFVIVAGEIDLSVGSVFALSGVVMGLVAEIHPLLGILAGLMVGVVSGTIIGLLVSRFKLSSWIVSLAMLFALRGLILILAKKSILIKDPLLLFGKINLWPGIFGLRQGISILIIIFILLSVVCLYVTRYTSFGTAIYAVGGNEEAARMMGLDVDKTKIKVFVLSGFIASLSGILLASSSASATLSAGNVYETYAIAMCAIGGIKLTGGEGKFLGSFFGILIYFVINTIFTYLPGSVSIHWQQIIMGLLVLMSVGLQAEAIQNLKLRFNKKG